jgi:dihydropteroate synthase
VGGESTRPGSKRVKTSEEIERIVPVVKALKDECLISVDTMKADVARAALEAGAHIINDVSALTADPEMVKVVKQFGPGVILMHMRGEPRTMQTAPCYDDVVMEVYDYLGKRIKVCIDYGIDGQSLVVDPGIGFGKTHDHNLLLLKNLRKLRGLGQPLALGVSRKSLLGFLTQRAVNDRLAASLGLLAFAVGNGVDIIRVHDVKESLDVSRVLDKLYFEKE